MPHSNNEIKTKMKELVCKKYIVKDSNGKIMFKSHLNDAIEQGSISHDDALSISLELMYGIKNYEFNETTVLNELENLILKVRGYNLNENDIIKNSVLFFNDYSYEKEVLSEYIEGISPEDCVNVEDSKPQNDKPKDIKKYFNLSRDDLCYILGKNPDLTFEKDKVLKKQIIKKFSRYDFDFSKLADASIDDIKKYLETLANKSDENKTNELTLETRKQKQEDDENLVQNSKKDNGGIVYTKEINSNVQSSYFTKNSDNSRISLQIILEKSRNFNAMTFRNMVLLKSYYADIYEEVAKNNFEYPYNDIKKFIYYFTHFDEIKDAMVYVEHLRKYKDDLDKFYVDYNDANLVSNEEQLINTYGNLHKLALKIDNYHVYLRNKITDEFSKLNYFINSYVNLKNDSSEVTNQKTNVASNEKETIYFETLNMDFDALINKIRSFNYKKLSSMDLMKSEYYEIYQEISNNVLDEFKGNGDIKRFKYYFEHFDLINDCIVLINKIKQKENLLDNFNTKLNEDKLDKVDKINLILEFKEFYILVYPINKYDYCLKDKIIDEFDNLDYFIEYYKNLLDNYDFKTDNYIEKMSLFELLEKIRLFNYKKLSDMISLKNEYSVIYSKIHSNDFGDFNKIGDVKRFKYYFKHLDLFDECIKLIDKIKQKEDILYKFSEDIHSKEYFSNSVRKKIINNYEEMYNLIKPTKSYSDYLKFKIFDEIEGLDYFIEFYEYFINYNGPDDDNYINDINEGYIDYKIEENKEFFKDIKDNNKKRAIVIDEDNVKVVAGAGAGKTFIIEKKVNYLIKKRNIDSEKILCLCYTKKGVNQLNKKVNKPSNKNKVKVFTFHEFCRRVSTECGKENSSNRYLLKSVIRKYVNDIVNDSEKLTNLSKYFSYYSNPQLENKKFNSLKEYEQYREDNKFISLKKKYSRCHSDVKISSRKRQSLCDSDLEAIEGECVKSLGELLIANYLFMHKIEYKYEDRYPYNDMAEVIYQRFLYSGAYFSLGSINRLYDNEKIVKDFISWEKNKRYFPDFYLPKYDIYIEHFGVDKNMEATFLEGEAKEKYERDMIYKPIQHKIYGTDLIQTYWYYLQEDKLLSELEKALKEYHVEINQMSQEEIVNTLIHNERVKEFDDFSRLIKDFINIYESKNLKKINFDEFRSKNTNEDTYTKNRQNLFFDIVEEIYNDYYDENKKGNLSHNHEIFNALNLIQTKQFDKKYDYIFIDEYQDVNPVRCKLLQELQKSSNSKIFVVGDDWQSIYGFTGSKVSLFTDFDKYFENPETIYIEENRRNPQKLIDISSEFIVDYNSQNERTLNYYKRIKSPNLNPIKIVKYKKNDWINKTLQLDTIFNYILKHSQNPKILILGRNNNDIDDYIGNSLFKEKGHNKIRKIIYSQRPDLDITFMTIHQAKGLEADEVIVLNLEDRKGGFPNKMDDDPILSFVKEDFESDISEERRLLYVALTRSRNNVYLFTSRESTSEFIDDLLKYEGVTELKLPFHIRKNDFHMNPDFLEKIIVHPTHLDCPICNGKISIIENNVNRTTYVRCSNYPRSRSHYDGGPYPKWGLNDIKYVKKCPKCRGILVRHGDILKCCLNYEEGCMEEAELKLDKEDLEFDYD